MDCIINSTSFLLLSHNVTAERFSFALVGQMPSSHSCSPFELRRLDHTNCIAFHLLINSSSSLICRIHRGMRVAHLEGGRAFSLTSLRPPS